jgi:hypothetical protein
LDHWRCVWSHCWEKGWTLKWASNRIIRNWRLLERGSVWCTTLWLVLHHFWWFLNPSCMTLWGANQFLRRTLTRRTFQNWFWPWIYRNRLSNGRERLFLALNFLISLAK